MRRRCAQRTARSGRRRRSRRRSVRARRTPTRASPPRCRARAARPAAARPRRARAARPGPAAGQARGPSTGRRRIEAASRTRPIGTFTRKTGRQPVPKRSAVTRTPPSTCPTRPPRASVAAQRLSACARDGPVKLRWMRLKTCGTISAAPAPWIARTTISVWLVGASPHASDAPVKMREAPDERRPEAEPLAQPRAGDQQHRVGDDVAGHDELQFGAGRLRSRRIVGIATLTMDASRTAMNWPVRIRASRSRWRA